MGGPNAWIAPALRQGRWVELFQKLGYRARAVEIPREALAAWGLAGEEVGRMTNLVEEPGMRVVAVEQTAAHLRRSLALRVARQNPTVHHLWCFIEADAITFAIVDTVEGRMFLRKMTADRTAPSAMTVEQISALSPTHLVQVADGDRGACFRTHFIDVLGQDGLTREFFRGFRDRLELLDRELAGVVGEARDRHELCLVVLLRLVFLYFLQKEGLLDGDRRFLVRRLRECVASGRPFWDDVLVPLFFGVLNTPRELRDGESKILGEIPFLNGGLFEPIETERELEPSGWTNESWTDVIEFFEHYQFTAAEPDDADECREVDPQMLGKVFEGLMYGDARHRSGAFYTPRDVVRRMVESALRARLTAVSEKACAELESGEPLSSDAHSVISQFLEELTILDPAVGTGAFLLESLWVLRGWYERLGWQIGWSGTRGIIHRHLYGVDVEPTAVRLCELRLWLAMLGTGIEAGTNLPPLPNLSHRIVAGDSLVEPGDLARLNDADGNRFVTESPCPLRVAHERRLALLQDDFLRAHGAEKRALRVELLSVERLLQQEVLRGRRNQLRARLAPLERVNDSLGLFGEGVASAPQKRAIESLREQLEGVDAALDDLDRDRHAYAFAYESRFGEAARRGFDIVLTNPPWVRATRVERQTRQFLRSRYRAAGSSLWSEARALGVRAPYGTQEDLAALFLERGLELLRPGGILCALVPAKLFRGLHGCSVRRVLAEHTIESVEDLSDADRSMFAATTYPAVLRIRAEPPSSTHEVEQAVWAGEKVNAFRTRQCELPLRGPDPAAPWLMVAPELRAIFRKMYAASIPLGTLDDFAPTRGVFTGANEVFVREAGDFRRVIGTVADGWTRPLVTGATLGAGSQMEIIWPYAIDGRLREDLPVEMVEYFRGHAARLGRRADRDPKLPPWQLFRVRTHTLGPKVAWRDIGPCLEAHRVDPLSVPLNTVYYIPCAHEPAAENLAAWLNCSPIRVLARELAERARGGWRRHFAWVIRMLPVPRSVAESGFREQVCLEAAFGLDADDLGVLRALACAQASGPTREVA